MNNSQGSTTVDKLLGNFLAKPQIIASNFRNSNRLILLQPLSFDGYINTWTVSIVSIFLVSYAIKPFPPRNFFTSRFNSDAIFLALFKFSINPLFIVYFNSERFSSRRPITLQPMD